MQADNRITMIIVAINNDDDDYGRPTTTGECECSKGGSLFPICKRIKGPREGDMEDYK